MQTMDASLPRHIENGMAELLLLVDRVIRPPLIGRHARGGVLLGLALMGGLLSPPAFAVAATVPAPAFATTVPAPAVATTVPPETAPLVVMNLAAHPDDEDGTTLAYYRHDRDAIAYSVIFTRGEGGQNEIGPELYEDLGAIRTRETERAARHLGTQVYFLNFKDFGYSKSAEETFETWGGRDEVISRLVYLIRKLKPDVLFTNHDTVTVGADRQHGHHQAVGLAAFEAFELAADPSYRPGQLEEAGVDVWQPSRLFRRLWSSDGEHEVSIPVGRNDPERGVSYAAMAGSALHEHASQGMDRFAEYISGWTHTYFTLLRSSTDAPLGPDDLAAGLEANESAEPDLSYWIDSGRVDPLPPRSLIVSDSVYVPGETIEIRWDVAGIPNLPVRLHFFGVADTSFVLRTDTPSPARLVIPADFTPTMPERIYQYERFKNHPPLGYAVYGVRDSVLLAAGHLDVDVAPALLLETAADVARLREGKNVVSFSVHAFDPAIRSLRLTAAVSSDESRSILDQRQVPVALLPENTRLDTVMVQLPPSALPGMYTVALSGFADSATLGTATADAFLPARVFDVEVPSELRVGVVESYDNTLDRALTELGIQHTMLDSVALADGRFDDLHTIVVDIRAYLVRQDLRTHNNRLLEWVRNGGHLVVQYQKTFEWNAGSADPFVASGNNPGNFAPYPIELGRDRVTREDAPVTVLMPEHPFFTTPNKLGTDTWESWVQERGLYFPEAYDDRYVELVSLHDPGEEPLESSTLLAPYGSGTYLYTALVWYRQLKEFHPGAYRAFANMVSLPLVDQRNLSQ